jgi:hypothetical protein
MNLAFVIWFTFLASGFWLISRSFLNSFYEATIWDQTAIKDFFGVCVSLAAAAASVVAATKYALLIVL